MSIKISIEKHHNNRCVIVFNSSSSSNNIRMSSLQQATDDDVDEQGDHDDHVTEWWRHHRPVALVRIAVACLGGGDTKSTGRRTANISRGGATTCYNLSPWTCIHMITRNVASCKALEPTPGRSLGRQITSRLCWRPIDWPRIQESSISYASLRSSVNIVSTQQCPININKLL